MISSTFGAPLGGTTRGAHHALDCAAFSLITPPNFGSGGGSCFPSMVVVALGEPGTPVVCWATSGRAANRTNTAASAPHKLIIRIWLPFLFKSLPDQFQRVFGCRTNGLHVVFRGLLQGRRRRASQGAQIAQGFRRRLARLGQRIGKTNHQDGNHLGGRCRRVRLTSRQSPGGNHVQRIVLAGHRFH